MDRYIGLDAHSTSCTLAVVGPSGRRLGSQVIETNGQALIEAIRGIPKPRHLCMEEGTSSAWLHELLSPHVDELVVVGVTLSRGPKSDQRDAFGARTQPHAATHFAGSCSQRDGSNDRVGWCLVSSARSINFTPRPALARRPGGPG